MVLVSAMTVAAPQQVPTSMLLMPIERRSLSQRRVAVFQVPVFAPASAGVTAMVSKPTQPWMKLRDDETLLSPSIRWSG